MAFDIEKVGLLKFGPSQSKIDSEPSGEIKGMKPNVAMMGIFLLIMRMVREHGRIIIYSDLKKKKRVLRRSTERTKF